jgi:phosphatidylserine/phosphatidylglycerophosphate/cardiolipin synthase-like enzyme
MIMMRLWVAEYREQLGKENIIRLTEGTHEKVMMIDAVTLLVGS